MRTITFKLHTNTTTTTESVYGQAFAQDDNATTLVFDFTDEDCATWDKWLDLSMSDMTKDTQSLGTGAIVSFVLKPEHTKRGDLRINPYAKSGTSRVGYPIQVLKVERQLNNSVVDASAAQSMIDYFDVALAVKDVTVETLAEGSQATASVTKAADGLTYGFGIPKGDKGDTPTKEDIGLSNVDNTSDINKPVSTAQATALDELDSKIANIVTQLHLVDGVDSTAIIQSALDKKGHIKIIGAGTYLTNRLIIDDDTIFELGAGVTLKKKDGTNTNILTNKGYLNSYRNKNIWLKGGIWDLNKAGNQGASNLGLIGVLLKGIDYLKITDVVSIGNESKYCYLIADCTNIYEGNINFNNTSDGLHHQPPIKNLLVENITGFTGDDMIAFTMGDYNAYALGITGDIENVLVRNVTSDDGTAEHIKLVGDGLNHTSKFRNMRFENIRGEAIVSSCCIMQRDQAVANSYLLNTYLENIVFSNIQPKMSGSNATFLLSATGGDITIENSMWDQAGSMRFIQIVGGTTGGSIDKLTIKNIKSITSLPISMSAFITCDSIIKQLNIVDCRFDFSISTASNLIASNGRILIINIDNSFFDLGSNGSLLTSTIASSTTTKVRLLNSDIKCLRMINPLSATYVMDICNSVVDVGSHFAYFADGGNLRINSNNVKYIASLYVNGLSAVRILALNGLDFGFTGLLADLTPIEGDKVRSLNATNGKGLWYYNGTTWAKFAS